MTRLSSRALNRALLARQMLLTRSPMAVADAIGHLVGMQAQVPTDPYVGLWSRLKDFRPEALEHLLVEREAVRIAAMRGTIHLMLAADALQLRTLTQSVFDRAFPHTPFGKGSKGVDAAAVVKAARIAVETEAMTLAELRKILAPKFPEFDAEHLSYLFHYAAPLVQVPPRGLWSKSSAPKVTTVEHWLGKAVVRRPAADKIVLRYLAAFGPASVMDAQAWSGLTRLAPVFEKLRPELVTFADDTGRELFDLPDAPRPDEDTPAPPRFLPTYDNVTLGFANRDRIINAKPRNKPADNAWVKSFTVDGFVAGFWKVTAGTMTLEPFGVLSKKDRTALVAEGHRLLTFLAPKRKPHAVIVT
jgi:hypothetical protein